MNRPRAFVAMVLFLSAARATAAEPLVVMPLGDSITAGVDGGYRKPLMEKLAAAYHREATTVGSVIDASLPKGRQAHEGHPGWRLDQLADHLNGRTASDDNAGYWLLGGHGTGRGPVRPTVVTLMAGINDINGMIDDGSGTPMSERADKIQATLQSRLKRVVDELHQTLPDTTILLGGCTPYANGLLKETQTGATEANRKKWAIEDNVAEAQELGVNHFVLRFNRWVRDEYVPQLRQAGLKAHFVDVYAPFILPDGSVRGWNNQEPENSQGPAAFGDYGLHPNRYGYSLIADAWAKAIDEHVGK
jgi:lysophospholipase L1-like esterase